MKKVIKLLSVALSLVLALVLFVSCGGSESNLLDSYLLEKNNTTVSADFTLDKTLTKNGKTYNLTWTSDKENVKITAKEENYLAEIVRPESGEVTVTLTVKVNNESKDFTVRVAALTAYDFAKAYDFAQFRKEVYEDFDLETSTKIGTATATISWAVKEGSENLISLSGNKVVIVPQTTAVKAELVATFTYKNETISKTYYVYPTLSRGHDEVINALYSEPGFAADMEGYVTAVATPYDSGYKNATFYLQDKDSNAGYYFYRSKNEDLENGAKLEAGAYVRVKGFTAKNYNGLWETDNAGTFVVDTTVEKKDMSTDAYAFDNDLLGNVYAAPFVESRYVSLTNWKVKSVNTTVDFTKSPATLMVLEKNGVEVNVQVSKYFTGTYAYNANDELLSAIVAKVGTFQAGSWVSVKGILGRYLTDKTVGNGFAIQPLAADQIVAGTEDTATTSAGAKVGALQATHMQALVAAGVYKDGAAIEVSAPTTFTLAGNSDVTIETTIPFSRAVVKGENGLYTVTPGAEEKATIIVTYTCGEYVTKAYYTVKTKVAGSGTGTGTGTDTPTVDPAKVVKTHTASYSGDTKNMQAGADKGAANAALIKLDADVFSALSDKKDSSNEIGLNKAGEIRLYNDKTATGNGGELTISLVPTGYKISTVKITVKQTTTYNNQTKETTVNDPQPTMKVLAGTNELTAASGVYTVNGTSFTIKNASPEVGTSNQLWITSIEIVVVAA